MKIWTLRWLCKHLGASESISVTLSTAPTWFDLNSAAKLPCAMAKCYEMPDFITSSVINEHLIIESDATKPAFHFLHPTYSTPENHHSSMLQAVRQQYVALDSH